MSLHRYIVAIIISILFTVSVTAIPNPGHAGTQIGITFPTGHACHNGGAEITLQDAILNNCFQGTGEPSGGLQGAGTVGKIPLWTGSINLGDSSMVQHNTNIGIGTFTTTNPAYPLTINHGQELKVVLSQQSTTDRRNNYGLGIEPGTQYYQVPASQTQRWYQGSLEKMRLENTGLSIFNPSNVNILTVSGNAGGSDVSHAILRLTQTSNGRLWQMSHRNDGNKLFFDYYNGATWSSPMVIQNDGNVGIGIATPSQKLHVSGNAIISGAATAQELTANRYCLGGPTNCITAWPAGGAGVQGSGAQRAIPMWSTAANPGVLTDSGMIARAGTAGKFCTGPNCGIESASFRNLLITSASTDNAGIGISANDANKNVYIDFMNQGTVVANINAINGRLHLNTGGAPVIVGTRASYNANNKLDVAGRANADQLCINNDCISSWPAATPNQKFSNNYNPGVTSAQVTGLQAGTYMVTVNGVLGNDGGDAGYTVTVTANGGATAVQRTIPIYNHPDGTAPYAVGALVSVSSGGTLSISLSATNGHTGDIITGLTGYRISS